MNKKPLFGPGAGMQWGLSGTHTQQQSFASYGEPASTQMGPTTKSLAQHLNMPPEAAMALFRPVMQKMGETPMSLTHEAVVGALPELQLRIVEVLPVGLANLVISGLHAYVRSVS
jgi:hypothetical protein